MGNPEGQGNGFLEDDHLAQAAAQGEQEAFAILVARYRRMVYGIAYKIVLNEEDALDVAQSVLLRLAERIGQFRGKGTFRSWLSSITARMAIDHVRRRASRREVLTGIEDLAQSPEPVAPQSGNPRSWLDRKMRMELVERGVRCLSPQQRAIFVLRFREEMGPKEIGERLGIPAGQVRSQLHRALAKMREVVGSE